MSSFINNVSRIFYSPLDQFDDTSRVSSHVLETLQPYNLFVYPRPFDARSRYGNAVAGAAASSNFFATSRTSGGFFSSVALLAFLVAAALWHFAPNVLTSVLATIKSSPIAGFSHLFLLATVHLITGAFITIWFTDFFYVTEDVTTTTSVFSYLFAPQIDFTFYTTLNLSSVLFLFFLLGGGEEEDDEDYLLSEEADIDLAEDVVAPLFVGNPGKDIPENGALYVKVCALFGFVLFSNVRGRLPFTKTATSSLVLTFWVSLAVFASLVTLRLRKNGVHYFFSLFRPAGCPLPLVLLLIPIEFVSYSFRLISLAVRLFANRRAGHTLRKVLISFSYVFFRIGEGYILAGFVPALVVFILIFLERGVAAIQAYIFTVLTLLYRKDIYTAH
jgi:ATP synthase subunit 6